MIKQQTFKKIMDHAKKINKEIAELRKITETDKDISHFFDPSTFWIDCDCIPELKQKFGGDLRTRKWFTEDTTFDAELVIDGVRFCSEFVPDKERDKYE